jgi:hypothetical protein
MTAALRCSPAALVAWLRRLPGPRAALVAAPVLLAACAAPVLLAACAAAPPPRWATGGATLVIDRARWERPDAMIDLLPDGRVLVNGDHVWTLDTTGRVYDADRAPVAVLEPEGPLDGADQRALGVVGIANASPPQASTAWLTVLPAGQVIVYDSDGASSAAGAWVGCQGAIMRTCTLVSHLVTLREAERRPRVTVGFGFGFGAGR